MKLILKLLMYELMHTFGVISTEKFADKKCDISYLLANEASRDFHKTCLNKRY
jgi:hypothetical protein